MHNNSRARVKAADVKAADVEKRPKAANDWLKSADVWFKAADVSKS